MATDEQKEEIRAKIDIAELVTSYGYSLKRSGSDLWCCCPFHQEKTPSFKVDSNRGMYHCFGCGESGDIFSFVMKQEGLSFGEAIHKLGEMAGVELTPVVSPSAKQRSRLYELMSLLSIDFNKMLKSKKNIDGELARTYLAKRKIDSEAVDKFLIGYAPRDVDKILSWAARHGFSYQDLAAAGIIKISSSPDKKPYFYFANRLVFSIKDKNGHVVAFSGRQLEEDKKSGKYVNSPETLIFKKSRNFYAYDEARKHIVKAPRREAIICEGQIDCIRLHLNGFNTAVAPLGTAFTEDHAVMLHRVADSAILCFDDDAAGHKATIRTAQLLLAEGMPIRVVSLPNGDDPDSFILSYGGEAFGKLINEKSESIVAFQIRVEESNEQLKSDSNAIVRITKAVLKTIACCKDGVLRNVLLKEAAKRLGIDYNTLANDIDGIVKTNQDASQTSSEQMVSPYIPSNAGSVSPPIVVEGAFINFLLMNEGKTEVVECVKQLIPISIIQSPLARDLYKVWRDNKQEEDGIRSMVENLPPETYKCFLSVVADYDLWEDYPISTKGEILYFARQLWHNHLVRILQLGNIDATRVNKVADYLKKLHSSTMKGVAHLITLLSSKLVNKSNNHNI